MMKYVAHEADVAEHADDVVKTCGKRHVKLETDIAIARDLKCLTGCGKRDDECFGKNAGR